MGLLGTIIIALIVSTPSLCQRRPRQVIASILQNLLSNPQLRTGTLCPAQYLSTCQKPCQNLQYLQQTPTVIEMPYTVAQPVTQAYQSYPVPVKEICQPQVTQQVQTVSQAYTPPTPTCPLAAPASMVNPFLPAASPVSALAPPTSCLLPPVNPNQCRCNYIRKIPIPPPCL